MRDRDGSLAIAKFPLRGDEINTVLWQALSLTLAGKAGITVPEWRLEEVGRRPVLLIRRFDRRDSSRLPFLSALSKLGAADHEQRSYLEFVDALRQHGAAPRADMRALWRRIVFCILISNTDDHLRNHGFLYAGPDGWPLDPAYDLNPVPQDIKPRVLSTAIDLDDPTASLGLAHAVTDYFEITEAQAREIAREVGQVVSRWRAVATELGVSKTEIDRMASTFEHEDRSAALA